MPFRFADLFAGIGGFHAAMSALGGTCVLASEIDQDARAVYERNWGDAVEPAPGRPVVEGDIVRLTEPKVAGHIPELDVVCAGFPCQPFSKSGAQQGINETRGTLFFNIAKLLEARRPSVILLENVRNLAGPRHADTWATIVRTLRELGYRVSSTPTVFSPHLLPPDRGGTPQVRERVFVVGTYVGRQRARTETDVPPPVPRRPVDGWDPQRWDAATHLPFEEESHATARYRLSAAEQRWIDVWDEFVQRMYEARQGAPLPGFPLWADDFRMRPRIPEGAPGWKVDFLTKNSAFYAAHREVVDDWKRDNRAAWRDFPPSRRKLEWQAQKLPTLWDAVLHLRPSGIRAKQPTYLPALVAITQTSVLGPRRRRVTPAEAARLQGLPGWFDFGDQQDGATYKQLGNGVAVGAAYHVFREHVLHDPDVPQHIVSAVRLAGPAPVLERPDGRRRTA